MEDAWWLALASAVLGAALGALASLGGTVWVQRREMARSARIRMFDELLPTLRENVGSQRFHGVVWVVGDGAGELDALRRCAVIAGGLGGPEDKLVADLRQRVELLTRPRTEAEGTGMSDDGVYLGSPHRPKEHAAVEEACRELEDRLERKIR